MNDLSGIRYGAEITAAATAHGLDPRLLAGVAAQETGGPGSSSGRNVVGDGGHGHGVFQIDDRSWAFARTAAAMDPAQNANEAASILAGNLNRYGGNVKAALSAYNAGSPTATGTTTAWADGSTLGYADSVLRHVAELGASSGQLAAEAPYTSAAVNALAIYNAASPLASCGAASQYTAATTPLTAPAPSPSTSNSQFTAVRTWASMTGGQSGSGGARAGSAADRGMADSVDPGIGDDDSGDD